MSKEEMICKNCKYHYIEEISFDYPQSCCDKRKAVIEEWFNCNDFKYSDKYIEQLQQENKQFKDNWNKLKKYMIDTEQIYKKSDDKYIKDMHEIGIRHAYQTILYKMYVLEQGSDSNE